ncbi:MAG: S9 family peptidase [Aureliella sp.]
MRSMTGMFRIFMCFALLWGLQCSIVAAAGTEDKRPLDHEDYDAWNSIGSSAISGDGKWASFVVQPADGQSTLHIREIATEKVYEIKGVSRARFTYDSHHAVFVVQPDPELVEKLKKANSGGDPPQPKVQILKLDSGDLSTIENASSFDMPAKAAGWIAVQLRGGNEPDSVKSGSVSLGPEYSVSEGGLQRPKKKLEYREEKVSKSEESKKEEGEEEKTPGKSASKKSGVPFKKSKKDKRSGATLVLKSLQSGLEIRYPNVTSHRFDENGSMLAFSTSAASGDDDGVHVVDLDDLDKKQIAAGLGNYGQVVFSKDGKQIAFVTDRDDYESDESKWSLYRWSRGRKEAEKIVDWETEGLHDGWILQSGSSPQFSEDGKRIYFRTRPMPEEEEESKEEVAKLDLWHWQDPFLQPQQLLNARAERNRSYQAVWHVRAKKAVQLADLDIPFVSVDMRGDSELVVGTKTADYDKMRSWDIQSFSDWYLVDQTTGERRMIAERARGNPSMSPGGKYLVWFDGEKKSWFSMATKAAWAASDSEDPEQSIEAIDIGSLVGHPVHNELHDQPSLPGSYGTAGWLEDDAALLIYDRWDLWQVDPNGESEAVSLTGGQGRQMKKRFRYLRLDPEEQFADPEDAWFSTLDHQTKATGFCHVSFDGKNSELSQKIEMQESLSTPRKARESDDVILTRSTFERFPDLWATTLEFESMRRLSRANPQQEDYLWGSAELVHWAANDGQELDGLLYKPEGFDPKKKYPLMVYFYERNSDNLHRYYAPAAGRSIINFSFYVSRGYVIFVPDIPYTVGAPGPSAENAILPGVDSIVEKGYIDPERIGMQGHSWGGYQTAYLVTVTDMFACAESGAPVSNMTSAYGGIRWGSGMSRMFQYEKTQSRIGGTLWEAREQYISNSPLFTADRINTPLLILHNDEDTAVPWYQGIELFVALRRLEKPAWMLNYNGEPHWVMKDANRMDFAIRMQQFFDHYLKGDPMPVWMADGIPAVDKGKKFGLKYVRPEAAQEGEEASEEENEAAEVSSED